VTIKVSVLKAGVAFKVKKRNAYVSGDSQENVLTILLSLGDGNLIGGFLGERHDCNEVR
jgi:hypothetical protein